VGVEFVKVVLMELIKEKNLFPLTDFPIDAMANGNSVIYQMRKDDNHSIVTYASVGILGNTPSV
jgi:hypothetical protein